MTEDEMVGWHHRLNGHESEQTLGDSEEQGSLMSCSSWGHKELDMTYRLNNNKDITRESFCWSPLHLFYKDTSLMVFSI